ncbi:Protein STR-86, partial [Aphelenchoides avenae]
LFDLLFNVILCCTWQPIPILPGGGAVFVGFTKMFGGIAGHYQFAIVAYIFAHCAVGLNYCFLFRYASLCANEAMELFSKKWYKALLFGSGEVICIMITALIEFRYKTLQRAKEGWWPAAMPAIMDVFNGTVYFGYDYKKSGHANMFLVTAILLAPLSSVSNLLCAALIIARLRRFRAQITVKTYKLHLQLSLALLIQTFMPLILFIIPMVFLFATTLWKTSNHEGFSTFQGDGKYEPVLTISLHPIFNACVTLAFVAPFRRALMPKFLRRQ